MSNGALLRRLGPLLAALPALLLGGAPIIGLLIRAGGESSAEQGFLDGSTLGLFARSIGIAAGAATLATLLGGLLAWGPARIWRRGGSWLIAPLFAALCVSPYAFALGWIGVDLGGERAARLLGSPWTAVGALASAYTPLAALLMVAALLRQPAGPELAGLLGAGGRRTLLGVVLPRYRAAFGFVWLAILTLCAAEYAAPSLLQVPTYPVEIFLYYSGMFDPVAAARACIPLIAAAAALAWPAMALLPRAYAVDREPGRPAHWPSPPLQRVGLLLGSVVVAGAALLLPLSELVFSAATTRQPGAVLQAGLPAIRHSLTLSGTAVMLALLLGWPLSWSLARVRGAARTALGIAALLPLGVPSSAYGIAWVEATSHLPASAGLAYWIATACLAAQYAGAAALLLATARLGIERNVLDAARLYEPSFLRREWKLVVPTLLPMIGVLSAVVFARQLNAIGILVLTVPPGTEVLALRADNLLHYGRPDEAALLTVFSALLSGGIALALLGVFRAASRRHGLPAR